MATLGTLFFLFFGLLIGFSGATSNETIVSLSLKQGRNDTFLIARHRKLLQPVEVVKPNTIWDDKCSKEYIAINQSPTPPLSNGIPTYTVEIINNCFSGCEISDIHVSCGWFSSVTLVNPEVFKRLDYDDCIVNDGKPLQNRSLVSFRYANTFPYPFFVTKVTCI
ncbi:hypothetical protein TanjilG_14506 [Lupinus angustifolius]|uniref:Uncharacterized protein n=1 Tax=Lupinus angustifolius TaxID=3871 RepID=A0A4P1RS52_LUPAN|nr:PREDICTED: TPD1 protein homolog 1-like [Lupinus angustifolius]OIW16736.1 hypothetical protein TanjilG_14506 [Lupinus angustifolius]